MSALKVPLRLAGKLALAGLDWLIGKAIDYNDRKDAKKAERAKGLTFKDVQNIEKQIAESTARRSAKTVVIPRPKP